MSGAVHAFTSSELAEIEQHLRTMRVGVIDAVRARLAGAGTGQARSFSSLFGAGDDAVEDMLTKNEIALTQHELAELQAIGEALTRIDFDIGGLCTKCGAAIPIARLRAVPTAATCIACAAVGAS